MRNPTHNYTRAADRLRDDIDPAKTWIVSDTHFGHDNIVGFCHRPEDHEQVMIAEWRKEVPDDATVLHLGDLAYRNNKFFQRIIAPELTGARKLLIRGNHDKHPRRFYDEAGFQTRLPFAIMYPASPKGPYRVSFSHYPWNVEDDDKMRSDDVRLHGHIHNNGYTRNGFVPFIAQHINLSVEQTKYRPVNLKSLLDGYLLGQYEETTQAQLDEARARKEANRS